MKNYFTASLRLPAVKLGIAYAAGCLSACFGNDFLRIILIAAAAVLLAAGFVMHRGKIWSAGLLAGLMFMSAYLWLYVQPLKNLSGSEIRTVCHITSADGTQGYSYGNALCIIDGKPAHITFSGGFSAETGDIADLLIELEPTEENLFTFCDAIVLHGKVKEVFSQERHFSLLGFAQGIRSAAAERLNILDGDEAELCKGLLLGETGGFSLRLRRDITYSGVNYMTAVSGAHITLVLIILMEIFGRERRRLHAVIAIITVPMLVLMFGFSASVMRAGLMMLFSKCGVLFSRQDNTLNSICAAFLTLTVFTPFAAADPALLMSVLGVFGAAILGQAINRSRKFPFERFRILAKIKQTAVISLCAMICTAPISISCFGGISLAVIPASVALAPFFTGAIVIGLMYVISGVSLLALPLLWIMKGFRSILAFFGNIEGVWLATDFGAAVPLAFLAAALLIIAAFLPAHSKTAFEAFLLSIALFLCIGMYTANNRSRITFVSDGQSGAAVICSKNEAAVMISGTGADLSYKLFNEFTRNGITHVRLVNAPQLDYAGAHDLGKITGLFPAETVLCPEALSAYAKQSCSGAEIGTAADSLTVDGTSIACAKSGDKTASGDIVIYYSYTRSVPEASAVLPLYASSRQNLLPENGINIYDEKVKIEIKE